MSREGQTVGGKYHLEALVGRAGLGETYKSKSPDGIPIAVKVLHDDHPTDFVKSLLGNARRIASVRHKRLAAVLGAKHSAGADTLILSQWLDGQSIQDKIRDSGPIEENRAASILFQVCSALAPLHKAGVPHGNLKPSNIFIPLDDQEELYVTLRDAVGNGVVGLQENNEFVGTVKNFSPEQVQGTEVSLSTDYFSLGTIAYFLVTGQYPFAAPTPRHTGQRITALNYRSISAVKAHLSEAYKGFISSCLQLAPSDRYSSLREAAAVLAPLLTQSEGQLPLETSPPPAVDADSTVAFSVPDELKAFLEKHDNLFDEEDKRDTSTLLEAPSSYQSSEVTSQASQPDDQQPFHTDAVTPFDSNEPSDGMTKNEQGWIPSLDDLAPGQELDDDLPFHSITLSQSFLDSEASMMTEESSDKHLKTSGPVVAADEETLAESSGVELEANETPDPVGHTKSDRGDEQQMQKDIMASLRSTLEAAGPLELLQQEAAAAPVADVSDFENYATSEHQRQARDANRFLSASAQTGLQRPFFTLLLLFLLGASAKVFLYELEEEDKAYEAKQSRLRDMKRRAFMKRARSNKSAPRAETPKDETIVLEGKSEGGAATANQGSDEGTTDKTVQPITRPTNQQKKELKSPNLPNRKMGAPSQPLQQGKKRTKPKKPKRKNSKVKNIELEIPDF